MQYIEAGDIKICYSLKGNGHPLVLIMGFTASMDWWDPEFIDSLSAKYRVLAFDNRGAGRTVTPREGEFSSIMFADDTASLMNALGIEKAHIFGFSMGGIIAQELAIRHPEKISKLILGGTFCGGRETVMPGPEILKVLMDSSGGIEGTFSRTMRLMFTADFLDANPGFTDSFRKRYMAAPISAHNTKRQMIAGMKNGTYQDLPGIKLPVLVVTGTDDILIPPRNSHIIAERIPGAQLIEYSGAGHCFMSPEREKFLQEIFKFLG